MFGANNLSVKHVIVRHELLMKVVPYRSIVDADQLKERTVTGLHVVV